MTRGRRAGRLRPAADVGAAVAIALTVLAGCSSGRPAAEDPTSGGGTTSRTGTTQRPAPTLPMLDAADWKTMQRRLQQQIAADPELDRVRTITVTVEGRRVVGVFRHRRPTEQAHVYSITKSVVSALVGVAVEEGKLHLGQTLDELLPEQAAVMSSQQSGITLQQLLTMTSGFPEDDGGLNLISDDPAAQMLTYGLIDDPGAAFHYSNSSAHLLAVILRRAIGQPILDYARTKLFDPLEIDTRPAWQGVDTDSPDSGFHQPGFAWATDRTGVNDGFAGLKLSAEDLAKLGRLYLDGGRWNGRQLVPQDWVTASTSPQLTSAQADVAGIQYGYLWWVDDVDGHTLVRASGSYYQWVAFFPERAAVIVVTAADSGEDTLWQTLDPVLTEAVLTPILG